LDQSYSALYASQEPGSFKRCILLLTAILAAKDHKHYAALAGLIGGTVSQKQAQDLPVADNLLEHLSPLGWEHINLPGDYVWRQNRRVESGKFRPLRPVAVP
jgi:Tn3 transposase DDE domain